jgi:hypothetical protein
MPLMGIQLRPSSLRFRGPHWHGVGLLSSLSKMPPTANPRARTLALLFLAAGLVVPAAAEQASDKITAVAAKASPDYARVRRKDGTYAPKTYAFGEGGHVVGPMIDASIDPMKFLDVARTIAVPLAERNYVPSHDPQATKLLIMVYWGLTDGAPEDK